MLICKTSAEHPVFACMVLLFFCVGHLLCSRCSSLMRMWFYQCSCMIICVCSYARTYIHTHTHTHTHTQMLFHVGAEHWCTFGHFCTRLEGTKAPRKMTMANTKKRGKRTHSQCISWQVLLESSQAWYPFIERGSMRKILFFHSCIPERWILCWWHPGLRAWIPMTRIWEWSEHRDQYPARNERKTDAQGGHKLWKRIGKKGVPIQPC